MAKYDAIIFDWDGVIYDSIAQVAQNSVEVCKTYGVDITTDHYYKHFSQPWWVWYRDLGIPTETDEQKIELDRRYWEIHKLTHADHQIFPDVVETLQGLEEKGIHLGIISAGLGETIKSILKKENLDSLFSEQDIIYRADHKVERIKEFCERNNFDLDKVLMVGDLPSDIENGEEAGVKTVGIARWESAIERLKKFQPDYLFESLTEILDII